MNRIIIQTADNSNTIFDQELQEIFHSKNGALAESLYVFIEHGFKYAIGKKTSLNILEIGFGTGLNTLLTLIEAEKNQTTVNYFSLETRPLEKELWKNLNYKDFWDAEKQQIFSTLHEVSWNEAHKITDFFTLTKILENLETYKTKEKFDLVYFDAFSPDKQPELWTYEIFEKIYSIMNSDSILVTYCAKGEVQRNMKKAGFKIEKLKGPMGKREMVRAFGI